MRTEPPGKPLCYAPYVPPNNSYRVKEGISPKTKAMQGDVSQVLEVGKLIHEW